MSWSDIAAITALIYVLTSGAVGVYRGCGCEGCSFKILGFTFPWDRTCGFVVGILWSLSIVSLVFLLLGD